MSDVYMGASCSYGDWRNYFVKDPPFGIQVPDFLQDPMNKDFPREELERLATLQDTRTIALRYVHDPQVFAYIWNSNTLYPQTRRWLRILVQIQTINAVCNGYEDERRSIFFF